MLRGARLDILTRYINESFASGGLSRDAVTLGMRQLAMREHGPQKGPRAARFGMIIASFARRTQRLILGVAIAGRSCVRMAACRGWRIPP